MMNGLFFVIECITLLATIRLGQEMFETGVDLLLSRKQFLGWVWIDGYSPKMVLRDVFGRQTTAHPNQVLRSFAGWDCDDDGNHLVVAENRMGKLVRFGLAERLPPDVL